MTDNYTEITAVTNELAKREEPYKTMYYTLHHAILEVSNLLYDGYWELHKQGSGNKHALTTCLCHAITGLHNGQSEAEAYFLDHPNAGTEQLRTKLNQLRGEQ